MNLDILLLISGLRSAFICQREHTRVLIFLEWEWETDNALQGNPDSGRRQRRVGPWVPSVLPVRYPMLSLWNKHKLPERYFWNQSGSPKSQDTEICLFKLSTQTSPDGAKWQARSLELWLAARQANPENMILHLMHVLKMTMRWEQLAFSENKPHCLNWFQKQTKLLSS